MILISPIIITLRTQLFTLAKKVNSWTGRRSMLTIPTVNIDHCLRTTSHRLPHILEISRSYKCNQQLLLYISINNLSLFILCFLSTARKSQYSENGCHKWWMPWMGRKGPFWPSLALQVHSQVRVLPLIIAVSVNFSYSLPISVQACWQRWCFSKHRLLWSLFRRYYLD